MGWFGKAGDRGRGQMPRGFVGARFNFCECALSANVRSRGVNSASQLLLAWMGQSELGDPDEDANEAMVAGVGDVVCVCRCLYAAAG